MNPDGRKRRSTVAIASLLFVPYWVYFLANRNRVLYVGMTSDLSRRLAQHRSGVRGSFTARYGVCRLVYVEEFSDVRDAATRE